jgi:hypothetical protein
LGVLSADKGLRWTAIGLAALNVVMIVPALISVAVGGIDGFDGSRLDLRFDRTVPEVFGYAQLGFAVTVLWMAGRRDRTRLPIALAAIGAMLLLDDALRVHETVGRTIDTMRDGAGVGPLRAKDAGDLLTWAVIGLLSLALLWWGTRELSDVERDAAWPWLWVPALLGFAVVFDVVGASQGVEILSLADDALEAFALTIAAVLAWARWRLDLRPNGSLSA